MEGDCGAHDWFFRSLQATSKIAEEEKQSSSRLFPLRYNGLVPDVKPFRLTESVKAAG
jgi:hypothetical protein